MDAERQKERQLCVRWKSLNDVDNRQEIYNFQNVESFQRFEMLTESDDDLKNCFVDCQDLNKSANKWLKRLNILIQKSFRKIRIKKQKVNPALQALFEQKESIRSQISELEKNEEILENLEELTDLDGKYEEVIDEISKICATKNKELVEE